MPINIGSGTGNVIYSNGNLYDSSGNLISGVASYTWAQFTAGDFDTSIARYVHVSDRHSTTDGTSTPGSLWRIDPTAASERKRNLMSGPVYYSTYSSAIAEVPASSWPNHKIFVGDFLISYYSNGTEYLLPNGQCVLYRSNVAGNTLITPAATFTSTTPSSAAAGADTLLTSAGVHGLTTAVAITAGSSYIYISGGTGWTVGFHKITAIAVDTTGTTVQIDTPYSAGFGTPTIALAGSTEVTMLSLAIPPLSANAELEFDVTYVATSSANTKTMKVKLGSTAFYSPTLTNATNSGNNRALFVISNRGATNSQTGGQGNLTNIGVGSSTSSIATGSVDTSVSTTFSITNTMSTANERFNIERYNLRMRS